MTRQDSQWRDDHSDRPDSADDDDDDDDDDDHDHDHADPDNDVDDANNGSGSLGRLSRRRDDDADAVVHDRVRA